VTKEFFIRDRRSGEIINCVTSSLERAQSLIDGMNEGDETGPCFYLDAFPPIEVLERYRYFRERP
jgi:hypothetical protein